MPEAYLDTVIANHAYVADLYVSSLIYSCIKIMINDIQYLISFDYLDGFHLLYQQARALRMKSLEPHSLLEEAG